MIPDSSIPSLLFYFLFFRSIPPTFGGSYVVIYHTYLASMKGSAAVNDNKST